MHRNANAGLSAETITTGNQPPLTITPVGDTIAIPTAASSGLACGRAVTPVALLATGEGGIAVLASGRRYRWCQGRRCRRRRRGLSDLRAPPIPRGRAARHSISTLGSATPEDSLDVGRDGERDLDVVVVVTLALDLDTLMAGPPARR